MKEPCRIDDEIVHNPWEDTPIKYEKSEDDYYEEARQEELDND